MIEDNFGFCVNISFIFYDGDWLWFGGVFVDLNLLVLFVCCLLF